MYCPKVCSIYHLWRPMYFLDSGPQGKSEAIRKPLWSFLKLGVAVGACKSSLFTARLPQGVPTGSFVLALVVVCLVPASITHVDVMAVLLEAGGNVKHLWNAHVALAALLALAALFAIWGLHSDPQFSEAPFHS